MNIIEYLKKYIDPVKAWPGMRLNVPAQESLFSRMEMEIREGIAAELEALVAAGAAPKPHGIPMSVSAADNPFQFQQDIIRGAANVVRGKNPATEQDWEDQAERMRLAALEKDAAADPRHAAMLKGLDGMFQMPGTPSGAPDAIAALETLQAERRAERLREWNE